MAALRLRRRALRKESLRQQRQKWKKRQQEKAGRIALARTGSVDRYRQSTRNSGKIQDPANGTGEIDTAITETMQALREEITTLKAENARLNQQLKEVIRLLNNPQQQRQQAPPQAQAQPAWQQSRVRTPPPPPPPRQQRPPATPKPERPAQQPRDKPVNPQPLETDMSEDEEEEGNATDPRSRDETPQPQSRSGIGDAVRLPRYTEKQDKLEKRVNALEHRMNTRFAATEDRLEAVGVTLQKMQEFLYKKLGRDDDNRDQLAQPQTSIWPGPQQQQAQA